jgi:hypothetical protein
MSPFISQKGGLSNRYFAASGNLRAGRGGADFRRMI